jgi:hypothetical protein
MSGTVFLRNKRIFLGGHDSISNISVPFYEGSWEGESDLDSLSGQSNEQFSLWFIISW